MTQNNSILFSVLAQMLDDVLILVDADNVVCRINDAAHTMLGGRILNAPLVNFLRHTALLDELARARAQGHAHHLHYRHIVAAPRDFDLRIFPFIDDMLLVVLTDISQQMRIEKTQADFVANVSHELRTPLSALVGFIETIKMLTDEGEMPPHDKDLGQTHAQDIARFLDIMANEAGRMQRLIDNLLNITKLQSEAHLPISGEVELNHFLTDICEALAQSARAAQMRLVFRSDIAMPVKVRADSDSLQEVFHNLIDNAFKYGIPNHDVHIHMYQNAMTDKIVIETRNHGSRIAAHHVPRLIERFYRVDKARTGTQDNKSPGGSGLGLAIVKQILTRHGAHLEINSTAEGINIFAVHMPPLPII